MRAASCARYCVFLAGLQYEKVSLGPKESISAGASFKVTVVALWGGGGVKVGVRVGGGGPIGDRTRYGAN